MRLLNRIDNAFEVTKFWSFCRLYTGEAEVSPVKQLILGQPMLSKGDMVFGVPPIAGVSYQLEFTPQLVNANWQTTEVFTGNGEAKQFAPAATGREGYYRLTVSNVVPE